MVQGERNGTKHRDRFSQVAIDLTPEISQGKSGEVVTGILDERIENLREAIAEIDAALAGRKKLSQQFLEQIERQADEAKRHLKTLKEPWQMGFYPEMEFIRLSLHKSLTSRLLQKVRGAITLWCHVARVANCHLNGRCLLD